MSTDVLAFCIHTDVVYPHTETSVRKSSLKNTGGLEITLIFKRKYSTLYLYKSQVYFKCYTAKTNGIFIQIKCQQATAHPHFPGLNLRSDHLLVDLQERKGRY